MDIKINSTLNREEWIRVYDALEYAIEEREYEAAMTADIDDRESILQCVDQWRILSNKIYDLVGWD